MFWQEDDEKNAIPTIPLAITDIGFRINCKQLPLDHAWELSQQIQEILPWLKTDKQSGIHQIHVAESGNGWTRPENMTHEVLYPSRRTRLYLRIPQQRIEETKKSLMGKKINIQQQPLTIDKPRLKPLVSSSIIFSRYVVLKENETENDFLMRMAKEINILADIKIKKMLCGKENQIQTPNKILFTRHLMIADLEHQAAIKLQQYGLGTDRLLGCGIFMPHKGIKSLSD